MKIVRVLSVFIFAMTMISSTAFAQDTHKEKKLIQKVAIPSSLSGGAELSLSVYDDNGIKVYRVDGATTTEEKKTAFKLLNNYLESGAVEQTNVNVTSYYTEFYGNEFGTSQINSNALGYTWAKYYAGNVAASSSNLDKTWGGQSGTWNGSGTAQSIKLYQNVTLNITRADASVTISWPPGISVSQSRYTSTGTWSSDPEPNVNAFGAEHKLVQYNKNDLQNGNVTSAIYSDSEDVKVSGFVYQPAQSVRFTNAL